MKCVSVSIALAFLFCTAAVGDDSMMSPEELQKGTTNVLAGRVGKSTPPVSGAAQQIISDDDEEDGGDDSGSRSSTGSKTSKKKKGSTKPKYSYRDELILNWILRSNRATEKVQANGVRSVAFRGEVNLSNQMANQPKLLASSAVTKSAKTIHLTGFCTIPNNVEVMGNSKGALDAYCELDKGRFKLVGDLIPKPEEYSLLASVIYAEDTNGNRYYPDANASKVLNSKKNSYNVATFVNTYALDKILRESIKSGSQNIATTATQYMTDLKASKTAQQVTMVPNAGAVTTTNVAKPVASDYITILGIQMSAEIAQKWADFAFQDHPWGFMTLGGSKIYVDLTVQEGTKK